MKDYWRPLGSRLHTELETYERLRSRGVLGVATAIAGGDVVDDVGENEVTDTQRWLQDENDCPSQRQHFRIVTREIGKPLETFATFTDFILYVYTALLGMFHHSGSRGRLSGFSFSASECMDKGRRLTR